MSISGIAHAVVVFILLFIGYTVGGKVTKGVWEPAYLGVAKSLSDLQKDYNLERVRASGEADTVTVYLQGKTEVREVQHEATEAEITRRVDAYLDSIARVQPVPKEGDTGSSSTASSLSRTAEASLNASGTSGLFAGMDRLERRVIKRIIDKAMRSQTRNIEHLEHLKDQEAEMQPLREKYHLLPK